MARSSDSIFPLSIIRDKTFQAREIRRVLALSAFYLVITTALMGLFYMYLVNSLVNGIAPLLFVSEDMQMANEAIPSLTAVLGKWFTAMLLINFFVTVCLGIFITRKLGQPLLAIKRSLREIGNGHLDVRLRASDKNEFGEISSELTAAMRSIREQIASAKQEISQANEQLQDTELDGKDQPSEGVDQSVRNCKLALDYFQFEERRDSGDDRAA